MLKYTGPKAIMTAKGTHNPAISYEALDIVYDSSSGNSYVAKIDVPPNISLSNTTYWNISANPNQAVASLQTDVAKLKTDMGTAQTDILARVKTEDVLTTEEELAAVTELGKIVDATVVKGVIGTKSAKDITYNNLETGIEANNVQDAIDYVLDTKAEQTEVDSLSNKIAEQFDNGFLGSKNLYADGNASNTIVIEVILSKPLPKGTYTVSMVATSSDTDDSVCRIDFRSASNGVLAEGRIGRNTRSSCTLTTNGETTKLQLYASTDYSKSIGDTVSAIDIQIEEGTQATPYKPYVPSNVQLSDEVEKLGSFKSGEEFTFDHLVVSAFLTSGGTELRYTINLPRKTDGLAITVEISRLEARQNGNYLINGESAWDSSKYSLSLWAKGSYNYSGIIKVANTSAWASSVVNNETVSLAITGKLKFN